MAAANKKARKSKEPKIELFLDVDLLESNFDNKGEQSRRHHFDDDELKGFKDELYEHSLHLRNRNSYASRVTDLIKSGLEAVDLQKKVGAMQFVKIGKNSVKELKSKISELLDKMNNGYEDRELMLYGIADHDQGVMVFYREDGHYEYHRPIYPHERQGSLLSINN